MKVSTVIIVLITSLPTLMYVVNPFGTGTYDPRARILGIVPYRISSKSMTPTLRAGDFIVASSASYAAKIPSINDVIVFKYPNDKNIDFVMRVLAREGETISLNNGVITVDGVNIDQPYLNIKNAVLTSQLNKSWKVPEGFLFVLGDNRDNSNDSRYWGFVPIVDVVGKVKMIWMSDDTDRIGKNVE
jgi:signal peptidase I